jgi:hypothetical protein
VDEPSPNPVNYRVIYSERVRIELKELLTRAAACGLGQQVLDAVKQIDARLRVYPQFGEPLLDLHTKGERLLVGTISPLVVRYIIDEENRLVFVIVPFKPLPHSGL